VLDKIFTPTALKLIEFMISYEQIEYFSMTRLAREIDVSLTALSQTCAKLAEYDIITMRPGKTDEGMIKILSINYSDKAVDSIMRGFGPLITFKEHLNQRGLRTK